MATVRRVRRVIRKFDPWTVFKVSLLLHVVFAAATLIGLLLMWSLVERAGIPASLDRFLITISLVDEGSVFFDNGSRFIRVAIFFSVVFGAAMTLLSTLAAVFYNLTSDVVGGVEVVMLEETLQVPAPAIPEPEDADLTIPSETGRRKDPPSPPPEGLRDPASRGADTAMRPGHNSRVDD